MKYLLVLLVLLVAFWIWRNNRLGDAGEQTPSTPPRKTPTGPVDMVACALCHTHIPSDEALPGRGGVFCCAEHRRQHEGTGA